MNDGPKAEGEGTMTIIVQVSRNNVSWYDVESAKDKEEAVRLAGVFKREQPELTVRLVEEVFA